MSGREKRTPYSSDSIQLRLEREKLGPYLLGGGSQNSLFPLNSGRVSLERGEFQF